MTDALAVLGLTPLTRHFLARRDVASVDQLCRVTPAGLLFLPAWLSPTERWERQRHAGFALRDVRVRLTTRGLALRGDRYARWASEPPEQLPLTPRAASLLRHFRVKTVDELLALSVEDLFFTTFRETAVRELLHTLAACGLHLRDGCPSGSDGWT